MDFQRIYSVVVKLRIGTLIRGIYAVEAAVSPENSRVL
jgi:hypothetical protein